MVKLDDLRTIKQAIRAQPPPGGNVSDAVIWLPERSGLFSIRSAWDLIRSHGDRVDWYNLIWFKGGIPKASFCLWLAVRGRLYTKDRMVNSDTSMHCLLCNGQREDHDHLFFSCSMTNQILLLVQAKCGFIIPVLNWKNLISWLSKKWRNNNFTYLS